MGKASSSKKVARAARAGGASKGNRRQWLFPVGIFVILALGISIVVLARKSSQTAAAVAPAVGDHIHNAFGIFVCDKYLPAVIDSTAPDKTGIHTHGDGIIHIHPFGGAVAGNNAKLSVFADRVGLKLSNGGITMPDGTQYDKGYDCNGTPAVVSAYVWSDAFDDSAAPRIYTSDFGSVPTRTDRAAIAMVIAPPGTDIPKPPSVATLNKLEDVAGSSTGSSIVNVTPTSVTGSTVASAPSPSTPSATSPAGQ
jgi:hypothetical protein